MKVFVFALLFIFSSVGWAEPNIPEKDLTCDLGGLDQLYEDLAKDVCYSGALATSHCVGYNGKAALENSVFTLGMGLIKGVALAVLSGIEIKEAAYEKLTESQKATRDFLSQVKGIRCNEKVEMKYMVLRIDEKIRLSETSGPGEDHPEAPERPEKPSDPKKMVQYKKDLENYKKEIEKLNDDPNWWCEPILEGGSKLYRFLELPEAKQRKLLCQYPDLREYYKKVMAKRIKDFASDTRITGLKCESSSGVPGGKPDRVQFVVTKSAGKTKFDLQLFDDGSAKHLRSSPLNPEETKVYKNWKQNESVSKDICKKSTADFFLLDGKRVDLVPGQFEFKMKKLGTSSALDEIHFINATGGMCRTYLAASVGGEMFDHLTKLDKSFPEADLPGMREAHNLFLIRGQEAVSCCREMDAKKKSTCLKQFDLDGLSPQSTAPVAQPPPKKTQKTKAHR